MKTFVLFGSTGDLATRYVLPALWDLLQKWSYDALVCVGRRDWWEVEFQEFLQPYSLLQNNHNVRYVRLDIASSDYISLKNLLQNMWAFGGEITYHLCLSPEYFTTVAHWIVAVGLNDENTRIMIEKPFWHDLKTAILLNLELQHVFQEDQIYRVDHYLGKNFVREVLNYRLEQGENWYSKRIKEISIIARETLTIEDRWEYYDHSGATRDFLQNHLLQVLAFSTMQMPHSNDQADLRDRIFQAISSIAPLLLDPRHDIIIGQYEWYRDVEWVKLNSRTETYIRTQLTIDDPLWMDTRVILETGKALDRKESSVKIVFQDGEEKVFSETAKNKNNAYETLIEKALARDASYFVRWDSVRAAWQVVDELLHCTDNCPLLKIYPIGSEIV